MSELKSEIVEIVGVGTVEFREPLFDEIAPFLNGGDNADLGLKLLRLCAYQDGKRMFDGVVGVSVGMALLKHVDLALKVCGMSNEKKDSQTESE